MVQHYFHMKMVSFHMTFSSVQNEKYVKFALKFNPVIMKFRGKFHFIFTMLQKKHILSRWIRDLNPNLNTTPAWKIGFGNNIIFIGHMKQIHMVKKLVWYVFLFIFTLKFNYIHMKIRMGFQPIYTLTSKFNLFWSWIPYGNDTLNK